MLSESEIWGKIALPVLMAFSSKYSVSLYKNAAQWSGSARRTYQDRSLQDFRALLGVEEGKYPAFGALNKHVLKPAGLELNALAPFSVSIVPIKTGKKVTDIRIGWWAKSKAEADEAWPEANRSKVGSKARISGTEILIIDPLSSTNRTLRDTRRDLMILDNSMEGRAMTASAVQKQRLNYHCIADAMRRLEWDLHQKVLREGRLPDEWHAIAKQCDEPKRVRVNLTVEEDVAKFFRTMGRNYQGRMNEVLRAFMHARLAGMLSGGETMDYFARRHDEALDGQKPGWGEHQKRYDWMEDGARKMSDQGGGVPIGEESGAFQSDTQAWFDMRRAQERG